MNWHRMRALQWSAEPRHAAGAPVEWAARQQDFDPQLPAWSERWSALDSLACNCAVEMIRRRLHSCILKFSPGARKWVAPRRRA